MRDLINLAVGFSAIAIGSTSLADDLILPQVPLSTVSPVEPNVMLLFDTSGSMSNFATGLDGNPSSRITVAKEVATQLVEQVEGVRFCLARFNGYNSSPQHHGGTVLENCGASVATLKAAINSSRVPASGGTPVAEAYYEMTRYFRGLSSHYNPGTTYTSPIQYRCQKNFIIALTDGEPTVDTSFPTTDPDFNQCSAINAASPGATACKLPDWDGKNKRDGLEFSDGLSSVTSSYTPGYTYYLDDMAKFAYDIDARTSGNDDAGVSFSDPKFTKQNILTYTVGFYTDNQMLKDAATYGDGTYFQANDGNKLKQSLFDALKAITQSSLSSTGVAGTGEQVGNGQTVYKARYKQDNWQGFVYANTIDKSANIIDEPVWEISDKNGLRPGWSSRNIFMTPDADHPEWFTESGTSGRKLRWGRFTKAGQQEYFQGEQAKFQYIRGRDDSQSDPYRDRGPNVLGDIVNSSLIYVDKPPSAINIPESLRASYEAFRDENKTQPAVLYVGANDGFLHGFDAENGSERMAYVPSKSLANLHLLANNDYEHRFFVDSTPNYGYVATSKTPTKDDWMTLLVGGMGRGGQLIYALNVTKPAAFTESGSTPSNVVLWEFTDKDDADLGYTYSQPQIMRFNDGKWYVVLANGYNNTEADSYTSATGQAVLYILDIETGAIKKKFATGEGKSADPMAPDSSPGVARPNGLAAPAGFDKDGDGDVEFIYAGDLFGNMWKFDVSSTNSNSWKHGKLFSTPCTVALVGGGCSEAQSITSAPLVTKHPIQGAMVIFGTGKFLESNDKISANVPLQAVYGLHEQNMTSGGAITKIAASDLLPQKIIYQGIPAGASTVVRALSDKEVTSETKGWMFDFSHLVGSVDQNKGEQVLTAPIIIGRAVGVFSVRKDGTDPCVGSSDNYLTIFDPISGGNFDEAIFDFNGDGKFDDNDKIEIDDGNGGTTKVHISSKKMGGSGGAIVIDNGDGTKSVISAKDDVIDDDTDRYDKEVINDLTETGRLSWRELSIE